MVGGDKFAEINVQDNQAAVAIGAGAQATINQYTEIIVKLDNIEELAPASGMPPYKGLVYYTEADANIFFGREAQWTPFTVEYMLKEAYWRIKRGFTEEACQQCF